MKVKHSRGENMTIFFAGLGITIISAVAEKVCNQFEYDEGSKFFNTTGGVSAVSVVVYEVGKLMVELNKLAKYVT